LVPHVKAGGVTIGNDLPMVLIAGTCVIESRDSALRHADFLATLASKIDMPLVFKSSFDKANRSSPASFRGPGLEEGIGILDEVKRALRIPVITDVHEPSQISSAAKVVDILQIPALLCRQTDLIYSAARSGRPVNIKKGQFVSPWEMKNVIAKTEAAGGSQLLLTERGSCFGYNNLVCDMRSIKVMGGLGCPVVFDATHSTQLPGALGHGSGGQPEFIETLARAAVAVGVAALFIEVHEDPPRALSDAATSLPLSTLHDMLVKLRDLDRLAKEQA